MCLSWWPQNARTRQEAVSTHGYSNIPTLLSWCHGSTKIPANGAVGLDYCLFGDTLSTKDERKVEGQTTFPPRMMFWEPRITDLRETLLPVSYRRSGLETEMIWEG